MVESNPLIAKNSSQFSDQAFWQGFFKESAKQESFEWYSEFEELQTYFKELLPAPDSAVKLLVPGCGDSLLSEKLALKMGYQNVVSIDFEPEVIARMQKRGVS
jgi:2-polyprenyl-3-methyl-5-hydroxy-6-metoxy-1,4-benzoquinol methylase